MVRTLLQIVVTAVELFEVLHADSRSVDGLLQTFRPNRICRSHTILSPYYLSHASCQSLCSREF